MADQIQIIKGFQDVLPPESGKWARLEGAAAEVFAGYGYAELRLPVLERTELFARGIGADTDIVEKEMFSFADRKGRGLSLRPEGTAGVVRAYLGSGLGKGEAVKWWYRGPMFRYERPQKGRYRQFHQIGAEAIGYAGPGTDAELIHMLAAWFGKLGVAGLALELNSLGCPNCRPAYREALISFLKRSDRQLCPDCQRRLATNPLRVLDCKMPECKAAVAGAPVTLDFLDADCKAHFDGLRHDLDLLGVAYAVNPKIVRGLDYYTRTVFEYLAVDGLGSQNAVAAGGRYDGLVAEFGGPPTPAIGFAIGMERVVSLLGEDAAKGMNYFIVTMGEPARARGIQLLAALRDNGLRAEMITDVSRSMKAQMKAAGAVGAKKALIIGDEELKGGSPMEKDMSTGEQKKANWVSFFENGIFLSLTDIR
jgi:histidyl-tRNA synthetase